MKTVVKFESIPRNLSQSQKNPRISTNIYPISDTFNKVFIPQLKVLKLPKTHLKTSANISDTPDYF